MDELEKMIEDLFLNDRNTAEEIYDSLIKYKNVPSKIDNLYYFLNWPNLKFVIAFILKYSINERINKLSELFLEYLSENFTIKHTMNDTEINILIQNELNKKTDEYMFFSIALEVHDFLSDEKIDKLSDIAKIQGSTTIQDLTKIRESVAIRGPTIQKQTKIATDNNNFPIIGIHSTTYDSLSSILLSGFNPPKEKIYGHSENWPVAQFSGIMIDYSKYGRVYSDLIERGRGNYVPYNNGLLRLCRDIEKFRKVSPSKNFIESYFFGKRIGFPVIISAFIESETTTYNDIYIGVYDNKVPIILGTAHITYTINEISNIFNNYFEGNNFNTNYNVNNLSNSIDIDYEWCLLLT